MKKKKKQQLIVPFVGLKEGMHRFEFEIDSAFFEQFEFSIIQQGDFKINLDFEKKPSLFNLSFSLKGVIYTTCDRCSDELELPIRGHEELIVKLGEENYEETDEIKVISSSEHQLDLSYEIYQYLNLLMPSKVVHKKTSDCNQEMIEKLSQLSVKKEKRKVDPRWGELSKLKDKSE